MLHPSEGSTHDQTKGCRTFLDTLKRPTAFCRFRTMNQRTGCTRSWGNRIVVSECFPPYPENTCAIRSSPVPNPANPAQRLGRVLTAWSSRGWAWRLGSRQRSRANTSVQARLRKATSRRPWVRVICGGPACCKYFEICERVNPAAARLSRTPCRNNPGRSAQSRADTS